MALGKLKRRSDFVAVREVGVYLRFSSVHIQVAWGRLHGEQERSGPGEQGSSAPVLFGITASRKVGKAVVRNFARRRMRAWCQAHLSQLALRQGENGAHQSGLRTVSLSRPTLQTLRRQEREGSPLALVVVVIANARTPTVPFKVLAADLAQALQMGLRKLGAPARTR